MRKTTVTYAFRNNDCIPMIRLRGKWLQRAGFEEGFPIRVEVTPGKLTLTLAEGSLPSSPLSEEAGVRT
jgi:hypothetical protein